MVNTLRKKFIITAMSSLLVVLILIFGVINIVNVLEIASTADETLSMLAENDGFFPENNMYKPDNMEGTEPPSSPSGASSTSNSATESISLNQSPGSAPGSHKMQPNSEYIRNMELPYSTRYFWVRFNSKNNVTEINTGHVAAVSSDAAADYAQAVLDKGSTKNGYINSYRYHIKTNSDGSSLIVFLDCSQSFLNAKKLFVQTLIIGLVSLVGMFILVFIFSGRAVSPVVESLEKQKRFITDAGHELKTPLAVISANIDVLEIESGKSEWTSSIKNQVKRLNDLIKNLLTLARMDEENLHPVFAEFNISKAIYDCATSFSAVAESRNKKYDLNIQDNIIFYGDQNGINQLASLLIDNAMKYSSENGHVQILLNKEKSNIHFEVSNTCDNMPTGNLNRLFDRFYRADSSRNRETGGYGIGLSVAKAVALSHGGTIEAKRDGDSIIRFVVILPVKKANKN